MAEGNLNKSNEILDNNDNFVETTEEELDELRKGSKSKNTNRSTNTSLNRFRNFLCVRQLPDLDELQSENLPGILCKFYTDVRTKKSGKQYQTGSFEVLRAGLNRHFKIEKGVDIVNDPQFMKANLIFESVQVRAKKSGKGHTKSTPHISQEDLVKIGNYLNVDHVANPQSRVLQHAVHFF